jgi:hypothetical protein
MHLDPAKSILDRIGYEAAAAVTGKHISRVYRWTYPTDRGGTGGVIPHADALKLLDHARANSIALTEADFMRAPSAALAVPA